MRTLFRTVLAGFAATLFSASAWAQEAGEGLPTPTLSFDLEGTLGPTVGTLAWEWDFADPVYVQSLREERQALRIGDCHPGADRDWPEVFSVMAYVRVGDAPDKAVICSFGNSVWLRKLDATTVSFGTASEGTMVTASDGRLSEGYHLIVATKTGTELSLRIDDGEIALKTTDSALAVGNGLQLGTRWEGATADAALATGLLIDEIAFYDGVALDDAARQALAAAYPVRFPGDYARTLADGASAAWQVGEDATDWGSAGVTAPPSGANVTLATFGTATLTMNADAAPASLTVEGEGALTFAADAEGHALTVADATSVAADVDASSGVAALGAVSIAEGKTLTVASGDAFSALSGDGTLHLAAPAADTEFSHAFTDAFTGTVRVTQGNLVFSKGNNGEGYPKQAAIELSGESAKMTLRDATDTTGWNGQGARASLTVADGATLAVEQRDTFNMPLILRNGAVTLAADALNSNRSFDLFTNASVTASGLSTIGGANATEDPETGDPIVESGIVAVRRRDLPITVEAGGTLKFYAQLSGTDGESSGSLLKQGEGTLEFFREATLALPVTVEAGTLRLTGKGQATTGAITVEAGATLALNNVVEDWEQTVAKAVSGAGANVTEGAGAAALTGDLSGFTGTVTVEAGTLDVPAGAESHVASVAEGAALRIRLTAEQRDVLGYTASVAEGIPFAFVGPDGAALTDGEVDGATYTAPVNVWEPTEAMEGEPSKFAWDNAANWSRGAVPEAGAGARVRVASGEVTLVLPEGGATVAALAVEGEGRLLLEAPGEGLTVSGTLICRADVVGEATALSAQAIQIDETRTLTLSSETVAEDPDAFDRTHAITLPPLTGAGRLVKTGAGALTLWANPAEPTITVQAGSLLVREEPTTRLDVTALRGADIRLVAWNASFGDSLNRFGLEGGASLVLANGLNDSSVRTVAGTVVVSAATEEPARIYGASFGVVELSAALTLAEGEASGTVAFAEGEAFGTGASATKYPCNHELRVTGAISGGLSVEVSDLANVVTLSGANAYTGGTVIAEGATLSVATLANAGGSGASVEVEGTLRFVTAADLGEEAIDLSGITGTGTIHYTGSGWRTLPNAASLRFASTLALRNEQPNGLVVTDGDTAENPSVTEVGTLSGSAPFRVDWDPKVADSRTLRIVQAADSEHTGNLIYEPSAERLAKVSVAGADGAAARTLTLSGATAGARPLEVEASGSVTFASTGSWAGDVTVAGRLGGAGTVGGALTLEDGATLDATSGALTVSGAVSASGTVTVLASAYGLVLNAAGVDATAFTLGEGSPEGVLVATDTALALVEAPTGYDDAASAKVAAFAAANGCYSGYAVVAQTHGPDGTVRALSDEEASAALACFSGDTLLAYAEGTVTLAYDFGITRIVPRTVDGEASLLVAVKAQDADGAPLTCDPATLRLLADGAELADAAEPLEDPEPFLGEAAAPGEVWFRVPLSAIPGPTPVKVGVRAVPPTE